MEMCLIRENNHLSTPLSEIAENTYPIITLFVSTYMIKIFSNINTKAIRLNISLTNLHFVVKRNP